VRKRIQKACPDATETMKWNVPFYELNGKILASMAAFKKHTKLGIWQGMKPEMVDVSSLAELPSAADYAKKLKAAAGYARGNSSGAKQMMAKKPASKKPVAKKAAAKKAAKKSPGKK
jgi:uncharacterized protein YdhG (YjbR/CyaY superfamily)